MEIKELKEVLTYKMKHTFLDTYIKQPVIDEGKLMALSIIVNNTSLSAEVKKQYIVTTMLVQMALDTHDLVPITNKDHEDESIVASRQLTVLAGDYYSGLYYLLLAEIKDINLIQMLATTIKEISEYKMRIYYKEVDSFEDYIKLISKIESLLIIRMSEFLKKPINNQVIEKIIITNKLIQEKIIFSNSDESSILNHWLLNDSSNEHLNVLQKVESIIGTNTKEIEMFLSESTLDISITKTKIKYMLNFLIYNHTSVVEEG